MPEPHLAVLEDMRQAAAALPVEVLDILVAALTGAPRVYIHAVGRSGLVMKMFAVRLAQLDIPVAVVGESTTPAASSADLLVVGSGSGRTSTALAIAERAREQGLRIVAFTTRENGPLAALGQPAIILPGGSKDGPGAAQPPGSLFEQMLFCMLEETVVRLARALDPGYERIRRRHANLE